MVMLQRDDSEQGFIRQQETVGAVPSVAGN